MKRKRKHKQDGDGYGSVVRGAGATADKGLCPAPGRAEDTGDFPALGEALGLSGQAGRYHVCSGSGEP